MGCCGKRKKTYDEHKKMLSRSSSRSAPVAASVPRITATSGSLTQSGSGSRNIYIEKSGGSCPTCGSRTIVKRQYSERLRRYFNVVWCSTCKEAA
jgi:DNA-directed RNA polymerase subunit RPC12/RpoP